MADSSDPSSRPVDAEGLFGTSPPWWADSPATGTGPTATITGPTPVVDVTHAPIYATTETSPPTAPADPTALDPAAALDSPTAPPGSAALGPAPAPADAAALDPAAASHAAPAGTAGTRDARPAARSGVAGEGTRAADEGVSATGDARPAAGGASTGPARSDGNGKRVRRRVPLYGGLVALGVAAVLGAGTVAVLAGSGDAHAARIVAAPRAAGLARVPDAAATAQTYPFASAALAAAGVRDAPVVSALYGTGSSEVLVIAGHEVIADPAAFLRTAEPATVLAARAESPGGQGGAAACGTFAVLAATRTYCAWATPTTYGFVAAETERSASELAVVARLLRADLEKHR
ncbi:hypothetical protein [Actinomadura atramentaria]|uniref:hypothetical protein n=1 Tax=Actinomadura atramentaria TaxID=1990 RepID=UPI0003A6EE2E|nr:hypothetical protein [Actinomadura atramentaria]